MSDFKSDCATVREALDSVEQSSHPAYGPGWFFTQDVHDKMSAALARMAEAHAALEEERDKWLAGYKDEIQHATRLVEERRATQTDIQEVLDLFAANGKIPSAVEQARQILRDRLAPPAQPVSTLDSAYDKPHSSPPAHATAQEAANCPTCNSPAPHLHPAVQHEGEVQVCADPFHQRATPQNTPAPPAVARAEEEARTSHEHCWHSTSDAAADNHDAKCCQCGIQSMPTQAKEEAVEKPKPGEWVKLDPRLADTATAFARFLDDGRMEIHDHVETVRLTIHEVDVPPAAKGGRP